MITVNIYKNKIKIDGHANYDKYGKDIVCAAVSSSVLTSINLILSINKDSIKVTDNLIIEIIKEDEMTLKILDNMINMLYELEKDYSKNIKIIKEE